jgi:hypothetical protein
VCDDLREEELAENELAVDVGGVCWGYCPPQRPQQEKQPEESLRVVARHAHREKGEFPSVSAAVLHKAKRICDHFTPQKYGATGVWLVTHQEPDFDALCAAYLVRALLTAGDDEVRAGWAGLGMRDEGWEQPPPAAGWRQRGGAGRQDDLGRKEDFDWFAPPWHAVPQKKLWLVKLAAYASVLISGGRRSCPMNRSLHSVLHATQVRGRDYHADGAADFFDEVRRILTAGASEGLNPLYDSVLEDSPAFAPELALLDREVEAYRRDLKRARRAIVSVPNAKGTPKDWRTKVSDAPLFASHAGDRPPEAAPAGVPLAEDETIAADQKHGGVGGRASVDGVYLCDPECVLFKEWARLDVDNSPTGTGFRFTAIAYTRRPMASPGTTRYILSLDPTHNDELHLYPLWVRLQAEEVRALARQGGTHEGQPRKEYKGRAGKLPGGYFADPWYDGDKYRHTIIDTPGRGTLLTKSGPGGDGQEDGVLRLVRDELEHVVFWGKLGLTDVPMPGGESPAKAAEPAEAFQRISEARPLERMHYRFGRIALGADVDLANRAVAEQIGRELWRHLDSDAELSVPADFERRHLIKTARWVGVWSRNGVIVAVKAPGEAAGSAKRDPDRPLVGKWFRDTFLKIVELSRVLQAYYGEAEAGGRADDSPGWERRLEQRVQKGEGLMQELAKAKNELARRGGRLLAPFFEASRIDKVLEAYRDVYLAGAERLQAKKTNDNIHHLTEIQHKIEWVEVFLVGVYALEAVHILAETTNGRDGMDLAALVLLFAAPFLAVMFTIRWLGLFPKVPSATWKRRISWAVGAVVVLFASYFVLHSLHDWGKRWWEERTQHRGADPDKMPPAE